MNEKMEKIVGLLKKILLWFILPLVILIFCFILGEQFEVGRLSAIAGCDGAMNTSACIRSKGYLANAPYYPCLLYTSPSPRDRTRSRMPSSA